MIRRVAITQPYVPGYRYPLWDRVVGSLREHHIEAKVFFGHDREQKSTIEARGDAVDAPWSELVETRNFRPAPRTPKLLYRRIPDAWRSAILLTEMEAANGNAWAAMVARRPYITMGHGREYTSDPGGLSVMLETQLNKRAAHVLTYLPSGRDEVLARTGLHWARVTAFNNSTDTTAIRAAIEGVTSASLASFRAAHGIPDGARIDLVLGALNEHKNIDLVCAAAQRVLEADSTRWVIFAGDGPLRPQVEQLAARFGRVVILGQAGPEQYAPAAKLAGALINPGRIGLVAVDALTMRVPILTTATARHAPEAEYLREGLHVHTSGASVADFAGLWAGFDKALDENAWGEAPSVEAAGDIITNAILHVVSTRDRRAVAAAPSTRSVKHGAAG